MAAFDWVVVTLLVGSMLLGLWRGLVYEVLSLLGWIAAFVLAPWFASDVGAVLPMGESAQALRSAAGFVLVFVGVLFAAGFVAWVVKKLAEAVGLRPIDRVLGALFGVARGAVLVLALAVVVHLADFAGAAWWKESVSSGVATEVLRGLRPLVPVEFGRYLP